MGEGGPVPLSVGALAGAAALLVLNGGLSLWLGLGLERRLLVAALRTVVQLTVLGMVLVPVFSLESPWLVAAVAGAMLGLAAVETVRRLKHGYPGIRGVAALSLLAGAGVTALFGAAVLIRADPWWSPRYLIPLLGMLLGNILTGLSLGFDRCLEELTAGRERVEIRLARGATAWEATRPVARAALRTGMVPILNAMSVVGLITIPGMMTGQLLGGTPPALAARYQILLMFLIAGAIALGTTCAILLTLRALFDRSHRLRGERIQERAAR